MCQMFSDGKVPYTSFYDSNRLIERVVDEGYRETRPVRMTQDHVWDLLQKCWAANPADRPAAQDVVRVLAPSRVRTTRTVKTKLFTDAVFVHEGGSATSSSSNSGVSDVSTNSIQATMVPEDLAQSDGQDAQAAVTTLQSELTLVSDVYNKNEATYKGPPGSDAGRVEDSDVYNGNEATYRGPLKSAVGEFGDNVFHSDDDFGRPPATPWNFSYPTSYCQAYQKMSRKY
ncbi:hypothetical protein NM688_g6114 [Phlebia brevispora]|uniref:Uncharacterized protein n=1 Tax=Phlebia brevispora TaxID=194682 RepID=A0ACC1SK37_9APHY|nr:hypothetical protein NM688_g6114 [Phlebia brevispora]